MCIKRIFEEAFPFWIYVKNVSYLKNRRDREDILREHSYTEYETLSLDRLERRLGEERQRGTALDEKTFKLTLSLSIGLTILGVVTAFHADGMWSSGVSVVFAIGILFLFGAGFLALGALRTAPTYGYGTGFLLRARANGKVILADQLARQETMNQIRHLRNETSYQALRNGFLLIFAGIMLHFITAIYGPSGCYSPKSGTTTENISN